MKFWVKISIFTALLSLFLSHSNWVWGTGYGIFDVRTSALGGTGVAIGDVTSGHYYNPALTSFHHGHEDKTRDGMFSFQALVGSVSEGARTAADAIDNNLEDELSSALDAFNDVNSPATASLAITAARDLEQAMREIRGENVDADGYMGISLSLPAEAEGGVFFMGSRAIVRGISDIAESDLELLNDYVEALEFVASEGTTGQIHPELLDENGEFLDPSDVGILSSAKGAAVLVSELGVSLAKQFEFWGQAIHLGVAPKLIHLRAFDERWQVEDGEFDSRGTDVTDMYFNFDLGVATHFAKVWRVGFAVKDMRTKTVDLPDGRDIRLENRSRLGVAYVGQQWQVGLDADIKKTPDLINASSRQDISLGISYQPLRAVQLRAGYRQDLEGSVEDQISAGVGLKWGRFVMELSYSDGKSPGGGLQLGWMH
jgi:hypothetical protein